MSTRIYEAVTARIVAELESGAVPWVKPWQSGRCGGLSAMPVNAVTGRAYSGVNIPILWLAADENGYEHQEWMTFNQARQQGAFVRKGEKGTTVVFTKRLTVEDKDADDGCRQVAMLRTFTVFNLAQIDGLARDVTEPTDVLAMPDERYAGAQALVDATSADIRHGGDRACYVPSLDIVQMPPRAAFETPESYFATELHELGHWSGATDRLDRDLSGRFGSRAYAAEEMIAELSAAFLCAHLGIVGELRHAGYIDDWLALLTADNRAIFTAASKASEAADYLRRFFRDGSRNRGDIGMIFAPTAVVSGAFLVFERLGRGRRTWLPSSPSF